MIMTRQAMLIDLARCAGCCGCVVTCQMQNNTRPGVTWVTVDRCEWDEYPNAQRAYLPHSCMQCDDPPCVSACPTGSSYQNEEGVTLVNYEGCICCGQCVAACPYGARHLNTSADNWFGAEAPAPYESYGIQRVDVAEKCIFCEGLRAEGRPPACVVNCPGAARVFGDIDDPESEIAQKIGGAKRIGETGFYYLEPAGMPSSMVASKVMAGAMFAEAVADEPQRAKSTPGINPVVLGGGAVVVAAAAVGVGVAVKKSRDKKKADANGGGKDEN
jgi:molybdopterin-containing oxidoreductase family iron-sulfur binding subunit